MRLLFIFVFLLSLPLLADDYIAKGRYTQVDISPHSDLVDPMRTIVRFDFPAQVASVGQAIDLVLAPSGYQLKDNADNDILYILSLPQSHRKMPEMRLNALLTVLLGDSFDLSIDKAFRKVALTFKGSLSSDDRAMARQARQLSKLTAPSKPVGEMSKKVSRKSATLKSNVPTGQSYVVEPGDSVFLISEKLGFAFSDRFVEYVMEQNPTAFANRNPKSLLVGATLQL